MTDEDCIRCAKSHRSYLERPNPCPHCWGSGPFPNVEHVSEPEEIEALDSRYDAALRELRQRAQDASQRDLEELLKESVPCHSMSGTELGRLARSECQLAASYHRQLEAKLRIAKRDEWERLRAIADPVLMPGYHREINFASLSVKGRRLRSYGDTAVFFHDECVLHRTSLFESNSLLWFMNENGDRSLLPPPPGLRSSWARRSKLGLAKLGDHLGGTESLETLIIDEGETSGDDSFIEVHIYGGFTIRSVSKVVYQPEALSPVALDLLTTLEQEKALRLEVES